MKSGKAAGLCGINAEMLKAGDSVVVKWLHRIVNIAWATGEVLKDWKRAGIIPPDLHTPLPFASPSPTPSHRVG